LHNSDHALRLRLFDSVSRNRVTGELCTDLSGEAVVSALRRGTCALPKLA